MQFKEKKAKRKINKFNIASIAITVLAMFGLLCLFAGISFIYYLLKDKPKLELSDFNSHESSIVFDKDNNQIYELGSVIRQNIEYEDIPTSLVDAFVAVEDSRFFDHNGFDMPRFVKALISNIKTLSFGQGGSTFTMQLIKNTYFTSDETGTGASKSIKRKVQEIALAMQLEKESTKKEIFTNYLNKLNFGGTSQNIRGVQKAAQYYFGKDVSELNIAESALLAGVINSPSRFNPYINLEFAQDRRDNVLYLMNYHGYITDNEYLIASSTRVEDMLVGDTTNNERGSGNGTPYQAYIDYVVEEVYNLTGLDPYTTSMRIHTSMDQNIQQLMDKIQAGNVDGYFEYPNDEFEIASICIRNDTGEILGILGGRNYADGGALLLNHATNQYKQPGSSIKPILDYVQAFEVLGWSTSHIVLDTPLAYKGTNYIITNSTNKYEGETTLKYALGMSLNTPAIQTIRELIEKKGNAYLVDYLTSMGFNIDLSDFDEQYGIGGKGLNVSCLQLAGAYAALMNDGYYTAPHAITRIEFLNEKAPITPTYQSKQTVSEQACYLMSDLLKNDVEGGFANLMGLFKNDDYTVYAKTGTTNWGSEGADYKIPSGSIKDGWVIGCTGEYSIATWMGYEKAQLNKPSYMTYDIYNQNIKGKITKLLLDETVKQYGNPGAISKPNGISNITHIAKLGTPYVSPTDDMEEEYITTGLIMSSSPLAKLSSPEKAKIENPKENPVTTLNAGQLNIKWPTYPDEDALKIAEEEFEMPLLKTDGSVLYTTTGKRIFDYTWIFGAIKYKADIKVNGTVVKSITSNEKEANVDLMGSIQAGDKIEACAYYGYEKANVNSEKKCVSDIEVNDTITIEIPGTSDLEQLKAKLSEYAPTEIIEKSADSNHSPGAIIIYKYDKDSTEPSDISSHINSTLEAHSLKLEKFEIIKYIDTGYTITLTGTPTISNDEIEITAGTTVTINANVSSSATTYTDPYEWYVDDIKQDGETDSSFQKAFNSNSTVRVKISNGQSAEVQIKIITDPTSGT